MEYHLGAHYCCYLCITVTEQGSRIACDEDSNENGLGRG